MSKDTDSVKSNKSTTSMRNARKKTEFLRKYLNENSVESKKVTNIK